MKLFNPSNINFDDVRKMTDEQRMKYIKQFYKNEFDKMIFQWSYTCDMFNINNVWQYIVAL